MALLFWFSLAVLAGTIVIVADVLLGWLRLRQLRDVSPMLPATPPRVSIIVPALDEARGIEAAMRSVLALDYPALQVVAVDDRSTDATGAILARLEGEFPHLEVVHIAELPAGWLGKNHALHVGASRASGELLLFTDADVVFERSAIARAVAHCEAERLDHLAIFPEVPARGLLLSFSMLGGFVGLLTLYRPWRAEGSRGHGLGIGAFNMVRAEPYRALGGHRALALEVVDDVALGRIMGKAGHRQSLLLGRGTVTVEIYRSMREMLGGLQKNIFAFLEFSAALLVVATLVTFAFAIWPWLGILVTEGTTRWVNVATAAAPTAFYVYLAPRLGYSRWCVLFLPFHGVLSIALYWQIAIRTWLQGGIVWRGTFYRLEELKARRAPTDP